MTGRLGSTISLRACSQRVPHLFRLQHMLTSAVRVASAHAGSGRRARPVLGSQFSVNPEVATPSGAPRANSHSECGFHSNSPSPNPAQDRDKTHESQLLLARALSGSLEFISSEPKLERRVESFPSVCDALIPQPIRPAPAAAREPYPSSPGSHHTPSVPMLPIHSFVRTCIIHPQPRLGL